MGDAADDLYDAQMRLEDEYQSMLIAGCTRCTVCQGLEVEADELECTTCCGFGWLDKEGNPVEP